MKKDITYVPFEKFANVLAELGLAGIEKKGFVRYNGARGRQIYVAKTVRVGRIDLSGFEVSFPGVKNLGGESAGLVRQRLDFSLPLTEEQILGTFRAVVTHMLTLPPAKPTRRSFLPRAPKTVPVETTDEQKKIERHRRAQLIADEAARQDVSLAPEAQALVSSELGE